MEQARTPEADAQRIRIRRSGELLAAQARVARSVPERMVGLLGRASLPPGEALIFPECQSIHTWGMRFPIDVIVTDRLWRVVALQPRLPPWRIMAPVRSGWGIIEMAEGSIQRAGLEVGDQLELQEMPGPAPSPDQAPCSST